MFTDMVGYTALGQRNESLSLALVEEQGKLIRPLLRRYNGREVKTMGDAFLVEFPSALEAVRCAYEIQRATREFNVPLPEDRRIHLRVGVHLGDVVESHNDISGDAVNIASRIEPLAEDGGVCLSREVFNQVSNKIELQMQSLGNVSLKNVAKPLEVFKVVLPWEKSIKASPPDRRRIAILPLTNISPDPKDEYFADGMTEELITTISQIRDLRVIARTSAMRYKGEKKGVGEIGRELEVGSLIEGSVRKAANRLRITVQLIDTQTEEHLWAQNYDRDMEDVFAVQSEIAKQVAGTLQVKLLGTDEKRLASRSSENVPAYLIYLKGRAMLENWRRQDNGLTQAKDLFESAISQDPNYAPAYAGLAETWYALGGYEEVPMQEARRKGEEYALKALGLDDNLAEAHVTLGIKYADEYRWKEAESEFKRAIELNPNYAPAHMYYADCLRDMGRFEEAQREIELAEKADPLSLEVLLFAIHLHSCLGQHEAAHNKIQKATRLDPENPNTNAFWAFYYYRKGDSVRAVEWLEKQAEARTLKSHYLSAALASLYVNVGKRDKAMEILNRITALPEDTIGRAGELAFLYGYLGNSDEFFKWATRAAEEKRLLLTDYRVDPELQYVRDDPRWVELLKKANLDS
jgi:TolB-like protein/Tfp pilus assembly protein PilF